MFQDPLFLLAAAAILLTLFVLITGLASFARGGEFNRKHGNRLMRYRIAAQLLAVVLILLFMFVRGG